LAWRSSNAQVQLTTYVLIFSKRCSRRFLREIAARGLTQTQAADVLGIQQPDVSHLTRGTLSRFSILRLERFLNALDLEIRIQIGPRPPGKAQAGITVEAVESF